MGIRMFLALVVLLVSTACWMDSWGQRAPARILLRAPAPPAPNPCEDRTEDPTSQNVEPENMTPEETDALLKYLDAENACGDFLNSIPSQLEIVYDMEEPIFESTVTIKSFDSKGGVSEDASRFVGKWEGGEAIVISRPTGITEKVTVEIDAQGQSLIAVFYDLPEAFSGNQVLPEGQ